MEGLKSCQGSGGYRTVLSTWCNIYKSLWLGNWRLPYHREREWFSSRLWPHKLQFGQLHTTVFGFGFFLYVPVLVQYCFIWRPSDSTVSEDVGIEPRIVATSALTVRRSSYSATSQKSWSESVMNNPDHISESLETHFFRFKYLNSLMRIRDPEWK